MTRLILSLVLGVTSLVVAACASPAREQPASQPPLSVRTAQVATSEVAERLEAGGVVAATESAVIASRVVAPVVRVHVRAGDAVHAGDVLVTLDARDAAAQSREARAAAVAAEQALVQARGEQAAATAEHRLAQAWHGRISTLRDKNSATAQELDEADARLAAAAAHVDATQAGIEQASARIDALRAAADSAGITESFAVLRAPFDGTVTERLTDPGNLATPGTPLLRIDAGGSRRVDVRVDEARARFVRPGDRVTVVLDGLGDVPFVEREGTVTEVARAVAADQRAFTVKVSLPAEDRTVPGSFARVRFRGTPRRAVTVPADAVRRQGQVASVFVVQDGVAHLRLIHTGAVDGGQVEVLAGLDAGEAVITVPPPSLTDGRAVTATATRESSGGRP